MRKAVAVFLLLIYSLTSFGVSATFHFCGNKLASVQIFNPSEPNDCCKGKPAKRKCCHNTHFKIKSAKGDQCVSILKINEKPLETSPFIDTKHLSNQYHLEYSSIYIDKFPILNLKVPIYIQNRVLII